MPSDSRTDQTRLYAAPDQEEKTAQLILGHTTSLDRKCRGGEMWGGGRMPDRGIFDKETRRKPLVFAADATPMEFESQTVRSKGVRSSRLTGSAPALCSVDYAS